MNHPEHIAAHPGRRPMLGFGFALQNSLRGLKHVARSERAVRQEMLAIAVGIPLAMMVSPHWWARIALIGVLLLVIAVELLNTAIEKLCDHVTPARHPEIGMVKDIGSAAVLCMLCLAVLVWGGALLGAFA